MWYKIDYQTTTRPQNPTEAMWVETVWFTTEVMWSHTLMIWLQQLQLRCVHRSYVETN